MSRKQPISDAELSALLSGKPFSSIGSIPAGTNRWPDNGVGHVAHISDHQLKLANRPNEIVDEVIRQTTKAVAYELAKTHFRTQEIDYYPYVWRSRLKKDYDPSLGAERVEFYTRWEKLEPNVSPRFLNYDWTQMLREQMMDNPYDYDSAFLNAQYFELSKDGPDSATGILASRESPKEMQLVMMKEVVAEAFRSLTLCSQIHEKPVAACLAFIHQDPMLSGIPGSDSRTHYLTRQIAIATFARCEWHGKVTAVPDLRPRPIPTTPPLSVMAEYARASQGVPNIAPMRFNGDPPLVAKPAPPPKKVFIQLDRKGLIKFLQDDD